MVKQLNIQLLCKHRLAFDQAQEHFLFIFFSFFFPIFSSSQLFFSSATKQSSRKTRQSMNQEKKKIESTPETKNKKEIKHVWKNSNCIDRRDSDYFHGTCWIDMIGWGSYYMFSESDFSVTFVFFKRKEGIYACLMREEKKRENQIRTSISFS